MNILGISAYYHDSAAALIQNGNIIAAAHEERFTRQKHDERFPENAIHYCLSAANLTLDDIDFIAFYDKPLLTFERLIETYLTFAPKGFKSFLKAMPVWLKEKLFLKSELQKALKKLGGLKKLKAPILFTQHHQSHAASAFFPSPFEEAAVLCLDGVGEWATTSLWLGKGNTLKPQWEIKFPHSLGLLYSAFTYFTGFKVNSGEYKLMGLAPYGEPKYVDIIYKYLIDVKDDGTYRLNLDYFDYPVGLKMTNDRFAKLFKRPARQSEAPITQQDMDLAKSIQVVTEDIVMKLAKNIKAEYGVKNCCLAGGVALNCVANGKIAKSNLFENIWIQPAAGDAGGALGAALMVWHEQCGQPRNINLNDSMQGAYLGPSFSNDEIIQYLKTVGAHFTVLSDDDLLNNTVDLLSKEKVIGWFQGRMEYGPRALGNRSIIGDARSQNMQSVMNLKIKFRESFRPFAPAVLAEKATEWFDINHKSPYMLLVGDVQPAHLIKSNDKKVGLDQLKSLRSTIPAVTHVDNTARVQTVHAETNPRFHALIKKFDEKTACPVLINTSFNVRGEPIVCTPIEAFRCFMTTHIDALVLENVVLLKEKQSDQLKAQYTTGETVGVD
ncbi:MAG: hypothetical protein A3E82_03850 [Gammaproteobacteria bacterium RIFCSPHIGHO2_12_FULL_38_11]|nr:MAG: hypothetical protein A3E82_03850 [Gammaproteobacteria bacterium RIFCSPHIGHO2_12_FULL_38_11]